MTTITRVMAIGGPLAFAAALAMHSCGDGAPPPPPDPPAIVDLNLLVLLDLSDRISPSKQPQQAEKDKAIIRDLLAVFERSVQRKLYVASRDRLRIAIAQQDGAGYNPSTFADRLIIDMRRIFEGGRPRFDSAKETVLAGVNELYQAATATEHYTGANIPLFFRDHLASYVERPEPGRRLRNDLVILTDGYVALDRQVKLRFRDHGNRTTDMRLALFRGVPDWERVFDEGDHGLIVEQKGAFSGMGALVLEIALDPQHPDDKPILFRYWRKWLGELGFTKTSLELTEDSSILTAEKIRRFFEDDEANTR